RPEQDQQEYEGEAEQEQLREPGAGEAQAVAPAEAVVLGAEPVVADVAEVFEIARVDDVEAPGRVVALAFREHGGDVTPAEAAQQPAADTAPGQLDAHAEAAARLDAGDRCGGRKIVGSGRCRRHAG